MRRTKPMELWVKFGDFAGTAYCKHRSPRMTKQSHGNLHKILGKYGLYR
jgi:hypothetical protein